MMIEMFIYVFREDEDGYKREFFFLSSPSDYFCEATIVIEERPYYREIDIRLLTRENGVQVHNISPNKGSD